MKLKSFEYLDNYNFRLEFVNNEVKEINLKNLISSKLTLSDLSTARIDPDWKCLEFKNGLIDIEPETLYKFCQENSQ